jgi:hypothetical protein
MHRKAAQNDRYDREHHQYLAAVAKQDAFQKMDH